MIDVVVVDESESTVATSVAFVADIPFAFVFSFDLGSFVVAAAFETSSAVAAAAAAAGDVASFLL